MAKLRLCQDLFYPVKESDRKEKKKREKRETEFPDLFGDDPPSEKKEKKSRDRKREKEREERDKSGKSKKATGFNFYVTTTFFIYIV